jgi:hypothetical protein
LAWSPHGFELGLEVLLQYVNAIYYHNNVADFEAQQICLATTFELGDFAS